MLSLKEFLSKKKIDQELLQQSEPELFLEFSRDYAKMGEKSFDHSKKFWFNKLRRLYHIAEEPKQVKIPVEQSQVASQAEPLESPTIEQKPEFTPRFRSTTAPVAKNETSETGSASETQAQNETVKPAFRPRFKPGLTSQPLQQSDEKGEINQIPSPQNEHANAEGEPLARPAFKPRFNPKNIPTAAKPKTSEPTEPLTEQPTQAAAPKPAFKPRFNAQNITSKNNASDTSENQNIHQSEPEKPALPSSPKPAFKPRFNMKNIAQAKNEPPEDFSSNADPVQKNEKQENSIPAGPAEQGEQLQLEVRQEPTAQSDNPARTAEETASGTDTTASKPVYKPRFNMRNVKPKPEE